MYSNSGYIELTEDNDKDKQLLDNEQIGNSQSGKRPYFKTLKFFERLKYQLNKSKEKDHVFRVIKLDKTIFPPVKTSNKLDNMKYGFILFIPLFLYHQFKYFFNLFYLGLCVSQFFDPLKIGFLFTYIGPLLFVLIMSLMNELVDEVKRVLDYNGKVVTKRAGDLEVGEIVCIKEGDFAPADILILHSSEPEGKVHVKTDQIDGETDIKIRKAVGHSYKLFENGKNIQKENLEIVIDTPNDLIHNFQGAMHQLDSKEKQIVDVHAIGVDNAIWAQCSIAKGDIKGMVVYSGNDTKLMMSMEKTDPKRSKADDELNTLSKLLFLIMVAASVLLMAIRGRVSLQSSQAIQFFRYILLLCSIIPISMKVNQDLSKLYFASRIANDKELVNTTPRNSMIAEDLGRIEYFLTDKTGTLTKNEMILKDLSLGDTLLDASKLNEMGDIAKRVSKKNLKFEGENLSMDEKFYRMLASILTCHAVFPTMIKEERVLESISPDELSFIEFAEHIGFKLHSRTDHIVSFKNAQDEYFEFKILKIFPFTSSRRRMGVILEYKDTIYYFLKGADSIMVPFLKLDSRDKALEHTALLSGKGLRTLVFSQAVIDKDKYEGWSEKYRIAQASLKDRKERMEFCINELEHDMDFVGITAVEDLLQDNVAVCIETLRQAGIKVWMLTGDKMQTARSISLTTGLYNKNQDKLYTLKEVTDKETMTKKLQELSDEVKPENLQKEGKKNAFLLIDGMSLALATRHGNLGLFLEVASKISSVCCCRCAPSQKREITKAVKMSGKRVLGIGDGGNDVGMIEEAHIGIGIAGKEGKQAALSSDYSIGEFQAVVKLLLWHGRLIYINTAKMSMWIMHRGMIISAMQFCFCVMFFLIDIPLFNGILMFGYSTIFTNFPVIAIITDVDLTYETMKKFPVLYKRLIQGRLLKAKAFIIMTIKSIIQGTMIMYLTNLIFPDNFFDIVTIQFSALIVTELFNTLTITSHISLLQLILIAISLLIYALVIIFLKGYINVNEFGPTFLVKVLMIVLGSWGFVSIPGMIYDYLYPTLDAKVYKIQKGEKVDLSNQQNQVKPESNISSHQSNPFLGN